MTSILLLIPLLLAAEPCDRNCLVAAAQSCRATKGSLPTVDLLGLGFDIQGSTAVTIQPGQDGSCSVLLKMTVEKAPPHKKRLGLAGDEDLTSEQVAQRANTAVASELRCEGTGPELAVLLGKVGIKGITGSDMRVCYATRCDPLPELEPGCKAGPCTKGEYAVACGANQCKMTGVPAHMVTAGAVYRCSENGGVGFRFGAPEPAKKTKKGK